MKTVEFTTDLFAIICYRPALSKKYDGIVQEAEFLGVDCWLDEDGEWYYLNLQSFPTVWHKVDKGFKVAKVEVTDEAALARGISKSILEARKYLQDYNFDEFGAHVPL